MESSWILVRLGAADAREVSRLEAACFPSFWDEDRYAAALADSEHCLGAGARDKVSGKLLGYVVCQTVLDELEVLNVAVEPDARGLGIASLIFQQVLHEAREKSIKKCCLEVRPGNIPAVRLYTGAGFVKSGLRKRYYSDGEDALVMTLMLA